MAYTQRRKSPHKIILIIIYQFVIWIFRYIRRFYSSVRVRNRERKGKKRKKQRGAAKLWRSSHFNCHVSAAAGSLSDTPRAQKLSANRIKRVVRDGHCGFAWSVLTDAIKRPAKRSRDALESRTKSPMYSSRGDRREEVSRNSHGHKSSLNVRGNCGICRNDKAFRHRTTATVWESPFFQEVN